MVGVEARKDLRDLPEVAIEELAQTAVVVNRARPGASRDEELEVRDAERVLDVDGEEAEPKGVLGVCVGSGQGVALVLENASN